MPNLIAKPKKKSKVAQIQIWPSTKERIITILNNRNRGQKKKQSLVEFIDDLVRPVNPYEIGEEDDFTEEWERQAKIKKK